MTAIITKPTLRLADRIELQRERNRTGAWIYIGKLITVILERQMPVRGNGLSRSGPHGSFTESQLTAWAAITLDWLHYSKAPILAISRDQQDLLLPFGLTPLPPIPKPGWVPRRYTDIVPRVPQWLRDRGAARLKGSPFLLFQPVNSLCVMLSTGAHGHFGRITGIANDADGTHLALLIDPSKREGYFVGGRFMLG